MLARGDLSNVRHGSFNEIVEFLKAVDLWKNILNSGLVLSEHNVMSNFKQLIKYIKYYSLK